MNLSDYPKAAIFAMAVFGLSGVLLGSLVYVPLGASPMLAGALGAATVFFTLNVALGRMYADALGGEPL